MQDVARLGCRQLVKVFTFDAIFPPKIGVANLTSWELPRNLWFQNFCNQEISLPNPVKFFTMVKCRWRRPMSREIYRGASQKGTNMNVPTPQRWKHDVRSEGDMVFTLLHNRMIIPSLNECWLLHVSLNIHKCSVSPYT